MVRNRGDPDELRPGDQIGRYRIQRELGRGGESVVYLATDLRLGKQWAVKVIRRKSSGQTGKRSDGRAEGPGGILPEEAELMKRLDHPALPRIVDVLEKDGRLILVMDYVEGENLADLLKRAGPFREEVVREWMYRLAGVLAYLHEQDPPVIYRDMKPANVIRKPDGSLVLLDLGIAREYKNDRRQDTTALGTKGYAPPEQYGNSQTDIRSDIYSLGMTAAELLTGSPPDPNSFLNKTHPFRKLRPDISEEFENILNRCLAFSPKDRYRSCRALMWDLRKKSRKTRKPRKRSRPAWGRPVWSRLTWSRLMSGSRHRRIVILAVLIVAETAGTVLAGERKQAGSPGPAAEGKQKMFSEVPAAEGGPGEIREEMQEEKPDKMSEIYTLLDACERKGVLTEEDSAALQKMLAELPAGSLQDTEDGAGLCLAVGQAYFYRYAGDGGSFRSRVLRARPYFEMAAEAGEYLKLCDFFSRYLFDREESTEPEPEECEEMLQAIRQCLEETEMPDDGDGAWLQLLLLQNFGECISEYRQSFADAGISREDLLQIVDRLEEDAAGVPAKNAKQKELQKEILGRCVKYREDIGHTYENMEKWKEAESIYG